MPASLITLPQSAVSSAKNFAVSAGTRGANLERQALQPCGDLGTAQHFDRVAVDPLRQRGRRPGRRHEAEPGDRAEARHAGLREGRQFRRRLGALQVGDRQDLQLAATMQRHRGGERVEEHIDVAGEDIGQRLLRAAIGHRQHLDSSQRLKQRRRQMRGRLRALRRERELARIGLAVRDQLLERVRGQAGANRKHVGDLGQHGDRHPVERTVGQVLRQQMGERDRRGRRHEQRIAVGRRA